MSVMRKIKQRNETENVGVQGRRVYRWLKNCQQGVPRKLSPNKEPCIQLGEDHTMQNWEYNDTEARVGGDKEEADKHPITRASWASE